MDKLTTANIVKLAEAQAWDGKLPTTMMGDGVMPIMDIRPTSGK